MAKPEEQQHNIGQQVVNLENDITLLRSTILESLLMGDSMFGTAGHIDIRNEVKSRNTKLQEEYNQIRGNIDKKEAIIRKTNRDFTDVKDTLPEIQPSDRLHVFEDYTAAFLSISYLFMIISFIYVYTYTSDSKMNAFLRSLLISIIITLLFFIISYYVI